MKKFIPLLITGLVITACAPSTPQSRIAKHPEKFAALDRKEQNLVQQGQIARGMSPDAVVLAWGFPDQQFEGSRNSKLTKRWDYASSVPVYTSPYAYGGFGYAQYGPYWNRGYYGPGFGFGPEVAYLPYRVASVWFVDNAVDSWERLR